SAPSQARLPGSGVLARAISANMSAAENNIHRGLEWVVVDTTRISQVMSEINALVYYGYPVQELAEQCSFEEVAWLIWHGELPDAKQLAEFQTEERSQ